MNGAGQKKGVRRPMNAFLIFCKLNRSREREKNPDMDNRSITRILGDRWAKMPPEEKSVFNNLAKETKDAFMKANPDYKWHGSDKSQGAGKSTAGPSTSTKSMQDAGKDAGSSAHKSRDTATMGGLNLLLRAGQESCADNKRTIALSPFAPCQSSQTHTKSPASSHKASLFSSPQGDSQTSSGKASSQQEHNSALLQLAEMCTSELYSAVPENPGNSSHNPHASLPLPPPKKRARQWSLDCSHSSTKNPKESDSHRNTTKHPSVHKKSESSSGNRKHRNASKTSHESVASSRSEWRPTDSSSSSSVQISTQSQSELKQAPGSQYQSCTKMIVNCDERAEAFRGEGGHFMEGRPSPLSFPSPSLGSSKPHHGAANPPHQPVLSQTKHPCRGTADSVVSLNHQGFRNHAPEAVRSDLQLVEKKQEVRPLFSEGRIASLLSSSLPPYAGLESAPVSGNTCKKADANIPMPHSRMSPNSCETPAAASSPIHDRRNPNANPAPASMNQSFTEGKLKKKWAQRMLVEARQEEESQSFATDTHSPSMQESHCPPTDAIKQEPSECHTHVGLSSLDRKMLTSYVKTEVKSELPSDGRTEADVKRAMQRDCPVSNTNTATSFNLKPELMQSNTLYRALTGQAPSSHFSMSRTCANDEAMVLNRNKLEGGVTGNQESKHDVSASKDLETKPVFNPIAACGKKIMDHIVERLFQTGHAADLINSETRYKSSKENDFQKQSLSPACNEWPSTTDGPEDVSGFPPSSAISHSSLMEKVVTQMCQTPSSQQMSCSSIPHMTAKIEAGDDQDGNSIPRHTESEKLARQYEAGYMEQNALSDRGVEDSNWTDVLEESSYQPVRKSRRANRGQKYQALIKEGIIQPSKERLAARNAQRNIRSCGSHEDLEKMEVKKAMKRSYSEREQSSAADSNCENQAADSTKDMTTEFDLEKEIASLPPCSYDQFEKRKVLSSRGQGESSVQKADSRSNHRPKTGASIERQKSDCKAPKISQDGNASKKDSLVKPASGQTASCHESIKELGCHTVHIPLIREKCQLEGLTGSRKRKARRHCITRISVAAPHEANAKSSSPASGGNVGKSQTVEDPGGQNSSKGDKSHTAIPQACRQAADLPNTMEASHQGQGAFDPPVNRSTPESNITTDSSKSGACLATQNFPALTLLSSVMIDSEKAVSPACQNKSVPTTQSPLQATLAKVWPTSLESVHASYHSSIQLSSPSSTVCDFASLARESSHMTTGSLPNWTTGLLASSHHPKTAFPQNISSSRSTSMSSSSSNQCLSNSHPNLSTSLSSQTSTTDGFSCTYRMTPAVQSLRSPPAPAMPFHPSTTVSGAVTSNAMKRTLPSSVPSAFVISTLTPSNSRQSKPTSWQKSNSSPNKKTSARKKRSPKGAAAASTEVKSQVESQGLPNMSQKTLDPGTKKLVKLLLKGNSGDEASSKAGASEVGCGAPAQSSDQQFQLSRSKPAPPKGAHPSPMPRQAVTFSSSNCLSLKSQLESGKQQQHDLGKTKNRKPTIWDHLNSPSFFPITSSRSHQNVPPPAKKSCKEIDSANQVVSLRGSKPGICTNKAKISAKSLCGDSLGSDTESASEETEDHTSSGTDSAEETKSLSPRPAGQKKYPPQTAASLASSSSFTTTNHPTPALFCNESSPTTLSRQLNHGPISMVMVPPKHQPVSPSHSPHPKNQPVSPSHSPRPKNQPVSSPPSACPKGQSVSPSLSPRSPTNLPPPTTSHSECSFTQQRGSCSVSAGSESGVSHVPAHSIPTAPPQTSNILHLDAPTPRSKAASSSSSTFVSASQLLSATAISVSAQSGQSPRPSQAVHSPATALPRDATTTTTQPDYLPEVTPRPTVVVDDGVSGLKSASKIPPVAEHHPSSATDHRDPVNFDIRVPSSLLEGPATHVSSSPCLPGSPSIAAVQS